MTPTCKDCGRPVLWATTSNGGRVPLDAAPHPAGFVVLDQYGCTGPLHADGRPDMTAAYMPHRLTCKKAES